MKHKKIGTRRGRKNADEEEDKKIRRKTAFQKKVSAKLMKRKKEEEKEKLMFLRWNISSAFSFSLFVNLLASSSLAGLPPSFALSFLSPPFPPARPRCAGEHCRRSLCKSSIFQALRQMEAILLGNNERASLDCFRSPAP